MSVKLPKVIRIHSDILNMDLRMNTKSFNIKTDDDVLYNQSEWVLLSENGLEVDRTIHNIKKIFGGDICEVMKSEQSATIMQKDLKPKQSEDCRLCITESENRDEGPSENVLQIGKSAELALF